MSSTSTLPFQPLDDLCINTIRCLAVDMVEKAKSGHPGLPLGSAAMAYVLWNRFLRFNPADPLWPDRDRFVLSAGHGCALLYALLHVTGFDLPIEELKRFRQSGSRTPGHPEYGRTPGVEATTGPLGQGFSNAVGMAIAETALAARFNRPDHTIVDHFTYVLASDGDLMEGVSAEAASLAGHLRLGRLIVLYADNHISIEGSTDLAFTEDRASRFAAYGWHVQSVADGNDLTAIAQAIQTARDERSRPSLICVRTHIGYGSPNKQDTAAAHGEPLGPEELVLTKKRLGWPPEPSFLLPDEALDHFRRAMDSGRKRQVEWASRLASYTRAYPDLAREFERVIHSQLPDGWETKLPRFAATEGSLATRAASGAVLQQLASGIPELMGGSADLAPSTQTIMEGTGAFQADNPSGRNMHFGVREHAMGAILNGMALHRGLRPYGATFLIFSDYMRPPMRLAAMNGLPVIYVLTHDSVGLGEDGPTHQPVEQLLGLRSIPGLVVIRPADANETSAAWRVAIEHRDGPVALALTRQKLPILDEGRYADIHEGVARGGYVLNDSPKANAPKADAPQLVIVATGSEVHLALAAQAQLIAENIRTRVVSMPCWQLFAAQLEEYRNEVVPPGTPLLAIEAGVSLGWKSYLGPSIPGPPTDVIAIDRFGESAPGPVVMQEYGFDVENVCARARALVRAVGNLSSRSKASARESR